jgi:hypothetical protein
MLPDQARLPGSKLVKVVPRHRSATEQQPQMISLCVLTVTNVSSSCIIGWQRIALTLHCLTKLVALFTAYYTLLITLSQHAYNDILSDKCGVAGRFSAASEL